MKLEEQSIGELRVRVHIISALIKLLRQDDDPRAPQAIKKLQDQQRRINEVLVAKIKAKRQEEGEPEPPAVVVKMDTLRLGAEAKLAD